MLFLLLFCGYASAEYRLFLKKKKKKTTGIVAKTRKSHLYYTRYWLTIQPFEKALQCLLPLFKV